MRIFYKNIDLRISINETILDYDINKDLNLKNLRSSFNSAIEKLSIENNSFDYWSSKISERNTLVNDLFLDVCRISLINSLINKEDRLVIYTNNFFVYQFFKNRTRSTFINKLKFRLNYLFQIIKSYLKLLKLTYKILYLKLRYTNKKFIKKITDIIIIQTWVSDTNFKGNSFSDSYFKDLSKYYKSIGMSSIIWPVFYNVKDYKKVFKFLRDNKNDFMIMEDYLTLGDYKIILKNFFNKKNLRLNKISINGLDFSNTFNYYNKIEPPEFTTIFYNFINRLNKIDSKNLTFIINHENMVGEKMLIMGTKKFLKKSKVIGYFHSSKPKNLLCLDYAGKKEFKIAPKPDKIIFNSNSYKIFFESKYSKLICKNGPALKQLYLNKLPNKKNISEDILVLFSGNYRDIYIMFKLLNNIKSKYSMIFRMHPMLLFDVKKYYTFNNYIVNNKSNLVDLITMSRKVISTYSATAIEASLIGKSVGLIYDKTRIRLNPYDDLGLNNYNLISDSLELQHFINDKTNLTKTRSVFNLDKNLINEFKNLN